MDKPPLSPERPDPFLEGVYHTFASHLITHGEIDAQLVLPNENIRYDRSGAEVHTYSLTLTESQLRLSNRPELISVNAHYEEAYMLGGQLTSNSLNVVAKDREGIKKDITLDETDSGDITGYVVISAEQMQAPSEKPPFRDIYEALEEWGLERHPLDMADLDLLRDILQIMNDD